jgi:hypothetical protein
MQRLNDAPILDQTEGMRDKLLMIALWKIQGDKIITITPDDIKAFNAAHANEATLLVHGHKDSIDLGVITLERAAVLAAHHEATTPKGRH